MSNPFGIPYQTGHQFCRMYHHMGFDTTFTFAVFSWPAGDSENIFKQTYDGGINNKRIRPINPIFSNY